MLCLHFITGDPDLAAHAVRCGVDRIFVDMETLGKAERQGHLDTHRAAHTLEDIARVRAAIGDAELLVRLNPFHKGSAAEVDAAIERGASRLMLPMFRTADTAQDFADLVAGRVPITLLAETPQALARVPSYLYVLRPHDELYFGLNDLSLAMDLAFLFEPLAARLLDGPAAILRDARVPFGFGGIGRLDGTAGRAPAELVLSEHVRLGSSAVILSRAFHGGATSRAELDDTVDLAGAIAALREAEARLRAAPAAELDDNARRLATAVFTPTGWGQP
jgi:hypothetical protein